MGGEPALQRVELVEDDALARSVVPAGHLDENPGGEARRRRRAHLLVALVGVVGVLVFALVGVQAVLDSAYREKVAARAALPGAIDAVASQPQVRWVTDAALMDSLLLDAPVDGAYVGARSLRDGTVEAVALDAATGVARWMTSLRGRPDEDAAVALWGNACTTSVLPDERDVLVCVLGFHARGLHEAAGASRAEVVALDARTGALLARRDTPAQAGRVVVVQDLAVVAWRVLGRVHVHAQDLLTGSTAWDASFPVPRTGTLQLGSLSAPPRIARVQLVAGPDVVAVGAGQQVYLLDVHGELRPGGRVDGYVRQARSDRIVLLTVDHGAGTILLRPGLDDLELRGVVAMPTLDDGSLSDVVLTVDDGLRGLDPDSGRPLWAVEGRDSGTVVLDGVVYQGGDSAQVRAVDGRTGTVLWSVPPPQSAYVTDLFTDGEHLYVALHGLLGADKTWLAYDLDGRPQGVLEPPPGWRSLEIRGRALVATSADGTRAAVLG
ncbi:outer membrane protein assembly factor BamB family protein [Cellulomonas persica]|uniref:Pyrrolo-quinoline quinone repeat domain-containing protein n=1 Tax=Cellulomonas persica TaxID=76861 RepID=A0A510URV2_9CELL|nr:PQQ-binding-like beta-propeller repeat protein [Cellulomonas persica]GEK17388.1 hypothetical protein CPE01_11210 [Cellulomonas persica]